MSWGGFGGWGGQAQAMQGNWQQGKGNWGMQAVPQAQPAIINTGKGKGHWQKQTPTGLPPGEIRMVAQKIADALAGRTHPVRMSLLPDLMITQGLDLGELAKKGRWERKIGVVKAAAQLGLFKTLPDTDDTTSIMVASLDCQNTAPEEKKKKKKGPAGTADAGGKGGGGRGRGEKRKLSEAEGTSAKRPANAGRGAPVAEGALVAVPDAPKKQKGPPLPKNERQLLEELMPKFGYKPGKGVKLEAGPKQQVGHGQKPYHTAIASIPDKPESRQHSNAHQSKKEAEKEACKKLHDWVLQQEKADPDSWKRKTSHKEKLAELKARKEAEFERRKKLQALNWTCPSCGAVNRPAGASFASRAGGAGRGCGGGRGQSSFRSAGRGGGSEQRIDPADGIAYPKSHFIEMYGEEHGLADYAWEEAEREPEKCFRCGEYRPVELQVVKVGGKVGVKYTACRVEAVTPGGAAETAGIREGMDMVYIGKKKMSSTADIKEALAKAADSFTIEVRLNGVELPKDAVVKQAEVPSADDSYAEKLKTAPASNTKTAVTAPPTTRSAKEPPKPPLVLKWAVPDTKCQGLWDGEWLGAKVMAGGPENAGTVRIKWDSDGSLSDMPPQLLRPVPHKL